MARAKVTLTGSLSLSIGTLRLKQNESVIVTDPQVIAACKGQSGVSVEDLGEVPAKAPAKAEGKAVKAQAVNDEEEESSAAKAQLAARRKVRSPSKQDD